jgi:hypothetical protein
VSDRNAVRFKLNSYTRNGPLYWAAMCCLSSIFLSGSAHPTTDPFGILTTVNFTIQLVDGPPLAMPRPAHLLGQPGKAASAITPSRRRPTLGLKSSRNDWLLKVA